MSLDKAIEWHRNTYRGELNFAPTQRTPPVAYQYSPTEGRVPDDRPLVYFVEGEYVEVPDSATQSTQVGMPMSGRMYRYLSGPTPETPWAASWRHLRTECRRRHRHHRGPRHWNGSLCHQLVGFVIVRGWSVRNVAQILEYDNPEPVLRSAFAFMEQTIDDYRAKAERRAREEEGKFTIYDEPQHHHVPSEQHVSECPNSVCRARRAA